MTCSFFVSACQLLSRYLQFLVYVSFYFKSTTIKT